jgi:hypothetical protein
LHHTVADARDLELTDFALLLWDFDLPLRLRVIGSREQFVLYGPQEWLDAFGLDVRKRAAIPTGDSAIPLGLLVRLSEGIEFGYVDKESPEPMRRFRLRLVIYLSS